MRMRRVGTPRARPASMKGWALSDRTCPRMTRAMVSQLTPPMARNRIIILATCSWPGPNITFSNLINFGSKAILKRMTRSI